MIPSARLAVRRIDLSGLVRLPGQALVVREVIAEIVVLHDIISRVVRRIDVDHLHAPVIAFLQELQHFEVVALDVEILRRVPVLALRLARAQRPHARRLRQAQRRVLAVPGEIVAVARIVDGVAEQIPQLVEIHLSIARDLREEARERLDVVLHEVFRFPVHFRHFVPPP